MRSEEQKHKDEMREKYGRVWWNNPAYREESARRDKLSHDKYVADLERLIQSTDPIVLAICREWTSDKFGVPGWGAIEWVSGEIQKAEAALRAVRREEKHES